MSINELRKKDDVFLNLIRENKFNKIKEYVANNRTLITFSNNYPIGISSKNGNMEITKYILNFPEVNPSDFNNFALDQASSNGHIDIVKLLLNDDRLDLRVQSDCIDAAYVNNHYDIVELLFNIDILKNNLKKHNYILYKKINILYRNKKILKFFKIKNNII